VDQLEHVLKKVMSIHILLVEDNEGDILLTTEALFESQADNRISVARDGEEAINFLTTGSDTPDLILLDINLPKIDGLEVLNRIKTDAVLKSIPVIMLSTSSDSKDIARSYSGHANCFISKPVDLDAYSKIGQVIREFWFNVAKLPRYT
jgi:two-component system, chemotaxis family, response regulator Rcp1